MIKLTKDQVEKVEKYWDRMALLDMLENSTSNNRISHNLNIVINYDIVEFLKASEELGLLKKNISAVEECRSINLNKVLMNREEYIDERMKAFAKNIDTLSIGQFVYDKDKSICEITNKSINSVEVYIKKKSDKGINCKQWFDMNRFNQRFSTNMVKVAKSQMAK